MSILTIRKLLGDSCRVQNRTLLSLDYREELPQRLEMYTTVFGGEMYSIYSLLLDDSMRKEREEHTMEQTYKSSYLFSKKGTEWIFLSSAVD